MSRPEAVEALIDDLANGTLDLKQASVRIQQLWAQAEKAGAKGAVEGLKDRTAQLAAQNRLLRQRLVQASLWAPENIRDDLELYPRKAKDTK